MNMDVKISNKILTNTQKIIHHDQMGFITGMQRWFDIHIPSNVIHQLSGPTDRNHTIISLDAEGGFNKIQYPFMIEVPETLRTEKACHSTKRQSIKNLSSLMLNGETLKHCH